MKIFKQLKLLALPLALMLVMAALFGLVLWGSTGFAGGAKTLTTDSKSVSVTVPELAPDFLNWEGQMIGMDEYPNGNALLLVGFESPDGRTQVAALVAVIKDKAHVVAIAVWYIERPKAEPDVYEDLEFLKTGIPTDLLTQVEKPDKLEMFNAKLTTVGI